MALPAMIRQSEAHKLLLQMGFVPLPPKKLVVEGIKQPECHPYKHPVLKTFVQYTSSIEVYKGEHDRWVYTSAIDQILE